MPEAAPARLTLAALTHNGCVRARNEDCIAAAGWLQSEPMQGPRSWEQALDDPVVCLILDGMGGHADGDVAARLAAQYLARELPACATEAAVSQCIEAASRHLFERMQQNPAHSGMGAVLAGMRIARDGILVFNVGDSRVYRVQDGYLYQLSIDDVRRPFAAHASAAPRSSVVTQCLGGSTEFSALAPHISAQSLAAQRTYLLCSDGLYDALDIEAMESALDEDLAASAARLLERALQAGARDNVSLILLRAVP